MVDDFERQQQREDRGFSGRLGLDVIDEIDHEEEKSVRVNEISNIVSNPSVSGFSIRDSGIPAKNRFRSDPVRFSLKD